MARQHVNIGTSANDGTGDPLRTAFDKINDNFIEIYGATAEAHDLLDDPTPQLGGDLDINGKAITQSVTNANISITANGTGTIELASSSNITGNLTVSGNTFLGNGAGDITQVTGVFEADSLQINGSTITGLATNGNITITPNGTGTLEISKATTIAEQLTVDSAIQIKDNKITSLLSNADLELVPAGTSAVVAGAIRMSGSTISSDDSTLLTVSDGVRITGTSELQGAATMSSTLDVTGAVTMASTLNVSGATTLVGNTTIDNIVINDSTISSSSNADITLSPGGTGSVVASALSIKGTSISSADSSLINLNESVKVTGTLTTADVTTTGTMTVTGQANIETVTVKDNTISTNASNADLELSANGTGAVVFNSDVTFSNDQDVTVDGSLTVDNIKFDGTAITNTQANGGLTITPNGTGSITLGGNIVAVTNELAAQDVAVSSEIVLGSGAAINQVATNSDLVLGTQGTGKIRINNAQTQTTVGAAGGASALPATPTGYLQINLSGTVYKIPFYAN